MNEFDALDELTGKNVVIDTTTPLVFIGRYVEHRNTFVVLEDVDVHDRNESQTSKDVYLMEAKKYGINKGRARVMVRGALIIAVTLLDDVIVY